VKAITSIAQEKVQREEMKIIKSGSEELFGKNEGKGSTKLECKFSNSLLFALNVDASHNQIMVCPYVISNRTMTKVSEVHVLVQKFIDQCKSKVSHIKVKKTKLSEKLIRLNFNMDYQRVVTLDAQNFVAWNESQ